MRQACRDVAAVGTLASIRITMTYTFFVLKRNNMHKAGVQVSAEEAGS